MKLRILATLVLFFIALHSFGQLKVSADQRFLETKKGMPFFWLGDTAWELFHRLSREEADLYLSDRAKKGFTVIQAVVLAELSGLDTPNYYGNRPLFDNDPLKPNEAYFKHVDYIVNKASKLGLIIAMVPSWGDKWNKAWGVGPEIFTPANAGPFGEYLGRRYKNKPLIWVMGGDRNIENAEDSEIIRAMAVGIKKGDDGAHLITFHPTGARSSSEYFNEDKWMDFHMSQTGHSSDSKNYKFNAKNRALTPTRPYLDGEPRYEDHPNQFNPVKFGWMDDFDARQTAYSSMLSGACGHTYGNHNIWQFYAEGRLPISGARTHWKTALSHPGSTQVGLMRRVLEKRPWQRLVPDQTIIVGDNAENVEYKVSSVSRDGDFMMVYIPYGSATKVDTRKIAGKLLRAWWFNPRDGRTISLGTFENNGIKEFRPGSTGRGSDWLLVIDDAAKGYSDPAVDRS